MSKYLDYDGLSHFKDKCDEEYTNTLATGYVKAAFTPELNVGYGFSGFTEWAFNITIVSGLTLAITWINSSTNTTYSCIGITSDDGLEYFITVTSMTEVSTGSSSGDYVTIDTDQTVTGAKTFSGSTRYDGNAAFTGGVTFTGGFSAYGSSSAAVLINNPKFTSVITIEDGSSSASVTAPGDMEITDGTNTKTLTELLTDSGGSSTQLYLHTLSCTVTGGTLTYSVAASIVTSSSNSLTVSNMPNGFKVVCIYASQDSFDLGSCGLLYKINDALYLYGDPDGTNSWNVSSIVDRIIEL